MGAKVRCPSCGAKNDASSRRCRVCTTIINMDLPEAGKEPVEAMPEVAADQSFDANVINQQLKPTKARFSSGSGALAARIAAAKGGAAGAGGPAPGSGAAAARGVAAAQSLPAPGLDASSAPAASAASSADEFGPSFDVAPSDFASSDFISFDVPAPSAAPPTYEPSVPAAPAGVGFDAGSDAGGISFDVEPVADRRAPSPPPAVPSDEEVFDPNALFRDMGN